MKLLEKFVSDMILGDWHTEPWFNFLFTFSAILVPIVMGIVIFFLTRCEEDEDEMIPFELEEEDEMTSFELEEEIGPITQNPVIKTVRTRDLHTALPIETKAVVRWSLF